MLGKAAMGAVSQVISDGVLLGHFFENRKQHQNQWFEGILEENRKFGRPLFGFHQLRLDVQTSKSNKNGSLQSMSGLGTERGFRPKPRLCGSTFLWR